MMSFSFPFLQGQVYLGPGVENSLLTQFAEALDDHRHLGQRNTDEHQIIAYIGAGPAAVAARGDVDPPGRQPDDGRRGIKNSFFRGRSIENFALCVKDEVDA